MKLFGTLPRQPILSATFLAAILPLIFLETVEASHKILKQVLLTHNFIPFHYDVQIRLEGSGFLVPNYIAQGQVRIVGRLVLVPSRRDSQIGSNSSSPSINLHVRNIFVNEESVTVRDKSLRKLGIVEIGTNHEENVLRIRLGRDVPLEEELELLMSYNISGQSEKLKPYYYTAPNRIPPNSAHRQSRMDYLFPCVNDPRLLSTYQLTILRRENRAVVSNSDRVSSEADPEQPGWVQDRFGRTPPMTLEHVGFWSSKNFQYLRTASNKNRIGVYMPISNNGLGDFIVEAVASIANFYEDFFGEAPGTKLDIVWHPQAASMVTPGLITMSELLPSGKQESLFLEGRQKETLILKLIGPILLQWFLPFTTSLTSHAQVGVDQLSLQFLHAYLKELGVASLTPEYFGGGTLELRQWCQEEYFMNTEPIHENKYDATEFLCKGMFSGESGAWLPFLRMISDENVAGEKMVREGILQFREKMKATPPNQKIARDKASRHLFMESLREKITAALPPHASPDYILSGWEAQYKKPDKDNDGFHKPYITVIVDLVNDTHLTFQLVRNDNKNWQWLVPVTVHNENGVMGRSFWLEQGLDPVIKQVDHRSSKWIMVNYKSKVVHRTIYHPVLLQKLRSQLEFDHTVFPPLARCRLLTDYIYVLNERQLFKEEADDNLLSVPNVLGLTQYLEKEREPLVWVSVIQRLQKLGYIKSPTQHGIIYPPMEDYQNLNDYLIPKMDLALRSLDAKNFYKHPANLLNLELQFLRQACELGSTLCRQHARTLLKQWRENPGLFSKFDQNLLSVIVMGRGREGYQFVFDKLLKNKDGEPDCGLNTLEKRIATRALSQTGDEGRLKATLDMVVRSSALTCTPYGHVGQRLFPEAAYTMTRSLAGSEVYRRFFFDYCGRNQTGDIKLTLKDLPKCYTHSQLAMMNSFLNRMSTCLTENFSRELILKEKSNIQERFNAIRRWMRETGTELFNWFGDNAGCTVEYCPKKLAS